MRCSVLGRIRISTPIQTSDLGFELGAIRILFDSMAFCGLTSRPKRNVNQIAKALVAPKILMVIRAFRRAGTPAIPDRVQDRFRKIRSLRPLQLHLLF